MTNCAQGMILCAEKGKNGEIYFLTDGAPTSFRVFIGRLLKAAGVEPPAENETLPLWLASAVATVSEWWAWISGGEPLLTNAVLALMAQEVTVNDVG